MMAGLLAEVRARGEPAPADATIAAHLLRISDPATGRALPDDRLAAEIGVFFTGGFETTGHTIAWALLMISQHARVEAAVLAELRGLHLLPHQRGRRALEYEDLARLTYTGQAIKARVAHSRRALLLRGCIKSSLMTGDLLCDCTAAAGSDAPDASADGWHQPHGRPRHAHRPAPHPGGHHGVGALQRRVCQPALLGARGRIPAGAPQARCSPRTCKILSSSCQHCSPAQERWDDADAEYARPLGDVPAVKQSPVSGAAEAARAKRFLPFSLGARDCVGQSLARMNFTATVAMLLSEFSFRLADEVRGACTS